MRLYGRQIFSHVGPNTLLSLRLVNKQFHAFLSAKSSDSIWKAARRRAKLPDIEDMTEIQYAELMFGKTCQGCYGDKVGKVYHDFFLRKNFCKRCRRSKIVDVTKLSKDIPDVAARLHPLAVDCVIKSARKYRVGRRAAPTSLTNSRLLSSAPPPPQIPACGSGNVMTTDAVRARPPSID